MIRLLPAVCAFLLAATVVPALPAQCQFQTVTQQAYGVGCSEVFGFAPTVAVSLDPMACELIVSVEADTGCCNTWKDGSWLVLGLQPTAVPLQLADPNCTLLAQPDLVFVQPGFESGRFALPIPPWLPPIQLHVQGVATYYTTILFPNPLGPQFSLTPGYVVDLQ